MKSFGFALPVMALAIAFVPRAFARPAADVSAAAGNDVARTSGQITWSGYADPGPTVLELSEVVSQSDSTAVSPMQGKIAKPAPSGVSTILGSHLFKRPGSKSTIRAVGGSSGQLGTNPASPEPSSLVLLGTGLLGLAFVVFRKAKSEEVSVQK